LESNKKGSVICVAPPNGGVIFIVYEPSSCMVCPFQVLRIHGNGSMVFYVIFFMWCKWQSSIGSRKSGDHAPLEQLPKFCYKSNMKYKFLLCWQFLLMLVSYLWPYLCHPFFVLGIFGCMYERFIGVCTQWWSLLRYFPLWPCANWNYVMLTYVMTTILILNLYISISPFWGNSMSCWCVFAKFQNVQPYIMRNLPDIITCAPLKSPYDAWEQDLAYGQ